MIVRGLRRPDKSFFPPIPVGELPIRQEISLNQASGVSLRYPTVSTKNESAVAGGSNSPNFRTIVGSMQSGSRSAILIKKL